MTARVRTPARFAAECVKRGVWHEARTPCASEKCPGPFDGEGWVIHDYWEYQPSKAQVMRDRGKSAERQANWRARKSARNAVTRPGMSGNVPIHNGRSNGVTNAVINTTPPRPEGSGAGDRPERPNGRPSPAGPPSGRPVAEVVKINRPTPDAAERGAALARELLATRNHRPP